MRGVARFAPNPEVASGKRAALVVFLRHSFSLSKVERTIGGRLHAYERFPISEEQLSSGLVPFELDLCHQDTAMWSEENGPFNVVGILDLDGSHDFTKVTDQYAVQTPNPGELVALVSGVDVSCHGTSPCIDMPLECSGGTDCTTIPDPPPITCRTPACDSDSAYCKSGHHEHEGTR